ncbi:hypothetical protein K0817_016285 [Microbacterium sp. HD4P20]|uniref:hypothetical protein n=1 Tax=Microbacterium sp. HD4P20 TaxID=2864874 RepID=UPI001C644DC9|nr:hypothetical protein [Microbacterium sp. HD4P20]MCP2638112.1 hypothetical protein [Microbacterium sp. HD4P20]
MDVWARFLQVGGFVALALTLIACLVLEGEDGLSFARSAYIVANALIFLFVILSSRRGGVSLLVAFFFLFFVAVPANLQIERSSFPWQSTYGPEIVQGYVVLSLAQCAYILGEWWIDSRMKYRTTRTATTPLNPHLYWRAVALILIASLAIAAAVGPSRLFLNREERSLDFASSEESWEQLLFIGRSISLLGAVICVYLLANHRPSRKPRYLLLTTLSIFTCVVLNWPLGLPRFQLLGAILALTAAATSFFQTRWKLLFGMTAPVFLFFFFPAIKALGYGTGVDISQAISRDVEAYLLRVDFDGFKQIIDTWIYTQTNPLRYGENFLGVALFWVPRSLWPSKPIDSGEIVSSTLGYRYTNVSNPLPAEALISFGFPGVIIVLLVLGVLVSYVEGLSRDAFSRRILSQSAILAALLMGYIVIILRGALNGVAPMFLSGFLLFALLVIMNRGSEKRRLGNDQSSPQMRRP